MNAVIDEDLPRSFGKTLAKLRFTVIDIRDTRLRGASDELVFQFAQEKQAVLFSADLGFSNIVSFPLGSHYGICILRFPNQMPTKTVNQMVYRLLRKLTSTDYPGNLIVLSSGKLRLRRHIQSS